MSEIVDHVAIAIGKASDPEWTDGTKWCMNARNRERLQAIARAAIDAMEELKPAPSTNSYDDGSIKVGDVIECRQICQFDGDLYRPMVVRWVGLDQVHAELLKGDFGQPGQILMAFELSARGRTWR